jgi:hypothetical protein
MGWAKRRDAFTKKRRDATIARMARFFFERTHRNRAFEALIK